MRKFLFTPIFISIILNSYAAEPLVPPHTLVTVSYDQSAKELTLKAKDDVKTITGVESGKFYSEVPLVDGTLVAYWARIHGADKSNSVGGPPYEFFTYKLSPKNGFLYLGSFLLTKKYKALRVGIHGDLHENGVRARDVFLEIEVAPGTTRQNKIDIFNCEFLVEGA